MVQRYDGQSVLLSQVLIALLKCPPSIWEHRELKSRLDCSAADKGCFGIALVLVLLVVYLAEPMLFVDDLEGIAMTGES